MKGSDIEKRVASFARELGFMSVGLKGLPIYSSSCASLFISASGRTAILIFKSESESEFPDSFLTDFIRNLGKHHQVVHVISSVRSGRQAIQGLQ